MKIIMVWRKWFTSECVVKELCWVSVQGCAQDCYIEEVNLSLAIQEITDLHKFRCQKLK